MSALKCELSNIEVKHLFFDKFSLVYVDPCGYTSTPKK